MVSTLHSGREGSTTSSNGERPTVKRRLSRSVGDSVANQEHLDELQEKLQQQSNKEATVIRSPGGSSAWNSRGGLGVDIAGAGAATASLNGEGGRYRTTALANGGARSRSMEESTSPSGFNSGPPSPRLYPTAGHSYTHPHSPVSSHKFLAREPPPAIQLSSTLAGWKDKVVSGGKDGDEIRIFGMQLKFVSLLTLALQNAALTIIMHYSRIKVTSPSQNYSAATAVLINEVLKCSISLVIALKRIDDDMTLNVDGGGSTSSLSSVTPSPSRAKFYLSEKDKEKKDDSPPVSPISTAPKRSTFLTSVKLQAQKHASTTLSFSSLQPKDPRSPLGKFLARNWSARLLRMKREIFSNDCWKLSIPAILYVVQNNLQYLAASNLDVATFQVTYQMKILTTAGFSVLMLGKKLSRAKWAALLMLAVGVGIVQIQSGNASSSGSSHEKPTSTKAAMSPLTGFAAVSAACFTSGLAGVYFEMVLKGSHADLWIRNIQLSLFSFIPAIIPVLFGSASPASASSSGFFSMLFAPLRNFGLWAWATVLIQVFGGLVTALVIKYSDNILKGFATSISIVLSFVAGVGLFGYHVTPAFVIGSATVLSATWMYNQPGNNEERKVEVKAAREREGRVSNYPPMSPVPDDAPILGDLSSRPPSTSSSMINVASAIAASISSSGRNSAVLKPLSSPPLGGEYQSTSGSTNGTPQNNFSYFLPSSGSTSDFFTPAGSVVPSRVPSRTDLTRPNLHVVTN